MHRLIKPYSIKADHNSEPKVMSFIPHTEQDVHEMLAAIGVARIEDLFDEIPPELRAELSPAIPDGLNEMAVSRLMQARAAQDEPGLCFIGAGAYEHYIP